MIEYQGWATIREAYREEDEPAPINVYGASKLAGEEAVREVGGEYLVVRVESLFGNIRKSTVRTFGICLPFSLLCTVAVPLPQKSLRLAVMRRY